MLVLHSMEPEGHSQAGPIRLVYRFAMDAGAGRGGLLPDTDAPVTSIERYARDVPNAVTDVLVLGIGGSSLGARSVVHALGGPNEFVRLDEGRRRVHFPDNPDPWSFGRLLERLDPCRTQVVVVSKSGRTVETAAQTLAAIDWMDACADASIGERFVAVTDPAQSPLRQLASEHGFRCFDIPSNVGGRFSVLTPAGLLPAVLAGLDVRGLLEGAKAARESCARGRLCQNPAGLFASLLHRHHTARGRGIQPLMPYSDALRPLSQWFVQIWAESLGKRYDRNGTMVECGPTPIAAVGPTDQHAQVQLFMEGPRDKIVTFIAVDEACRELTIPKRDGAYAVLGGHSFFDLLEYERRATAVALAQDERPSLTLHMARVDPFHLGALFFTLQAATAFAGSLYDVDTFDQPGVELGKRLTWGLLGRPGFIGARDEVLQAEARLGDVYVAS